MYVSGGVREQEKGFGFGFWDSSARRARLILIILLDSALVTASYTLNTENTQWRKVATFVDQNAKPTDLILINSVGASFSSLQLPFEFYFKGKNDILFHNR